MSQGQPATERSTNKASPISPSPTEPSPPSPANDYQAAEATKAVTRAGKSMAYSEPKASNALKLNESNYMTWSNSVMSYLVARGYWKYVSGRNEKPTKKFDANGNQTEESIEEEEDWLEMDRKAWYDIKTFCEPADSAFYKPESAKELWDRLKETKMPTGTTFYLSQIRLLTNYRQGPKETAEQVLNALRKIQADIQVMTPDTPIYDNLLREIFLGALREEPYGLMVF